MGLTKNVESNGHGYHPGRRRICADDYHLCCGAGVAGIFSVVGDAMAVTTNKPPRPPLTREQIRSALGQLFEIFAEWDGLIECEEDAEGFPVGDSLEANMKRLISEVTSRTSRLMFQLLVRGMREEPPIDIKDLGSDDPD